MEGIQWYICQISIWVNPGMSSRKARASPSLSCHWVLNGRRRKQRGWWWQSPSAQMLFPWPTPDLLNHSLWWWDPGNHVLHSWNDLNAHFLRTFACKDFICKVPSCKQHIAGWFLVCVLFTLCSQLGVRVALCASHNPMATPKPWLIFENPVW